MSPDIPVSDGWTEFAQNQEKFFGYAVKIWDDGDNEAIFQKKNC